MNSSEKIQSIKDALQVALSLAEENRLDPDNISDDLQDEAKRQGAAVLVLEGILNDSVWEVEFNTGKIIIRTDLEAFDNAPSLGDLS